MQSTSSEAELVQQAVSRHTTTTNNLQDALQVRDRPRSRIHTPYCGAVKFTCVCVLHASCARTPFFTVDTLQSSPMQAQESVDMFRLMLSCQFPS
jgi:hypothetical protein